MKATEERSEDRYEVIIRRLGNSDTVETDVLDDRQTQAVLYMIGTLKARNA
ncbi:MAG: hypothetical protein PHT59_05215 [Candidatus Omnitrophica bacterium]|nr:hypothetical protein [Candidatus Omnitrophota bacterium]